VTNEALRPLTDPHFWDFDNVFADYYRFKEWEREFDTNYAKSEMSQLSLVRFMHDHTGNFGTALNNINTPELQQADNDYAVGLLVQKIANSRYNNNTLIFVIEDDAQDAADHVDAHRSTAFIVGPYVRKNKVVSSAYNTVDFIRTIEEVLGLKPLNLNDSLGVPMGDLFDFGQPDWSYAATPSALLANTTLPIPASLFPGLHIPKPTHDALYWTNVTKGMDFSAEDRFNSANYNHILWRGLMGNKPYPGVPSGLDLRQNRTELLKRHQAHAQPSTTF
jgi:hypothetical protein